MNLQKWDYLNSQEGKSKKYVIFKDFVGNPAWSEINYRLHGQAYHTVKAHSRKERSDEKIFSFVYCKIKILMSLSASLLWTYLHCVDSYMSDIMNYIIGSEN